jgi:predicted NUDIX family NTP pyrophosphohydrolase
MSNRQSAGLLLHRVRDGQLEVLLVHPGGPFWAKKDEGAWSIPKGEVGEQEDALEAARREVEEETGLRVPDLVFNHLGTVRQRSGKRVEAWAAPADLEVEKIRSSTFALEWPPRSGRVYLGELDHAAGWFSVEEARRRLVPAQAAFLDRLLELEGSSRA